jgi:hypothetical protein
MHLDLQFSTFSRVKRMQQDFKHDKIPAIVTEQDSANNACHICY